jgi:hypothetical protein
MKNLKYLLVLVLAAGLSYAAASLAQRHTDRRTDDAAEPLADRPTAATPDQAAPAVPVPPPQLRDLAAAMGAAQKAGAHAITDEERALYRVPIIQPNPLQTLSVNGTTPELRAAAGDVWSWLKLTSEQMVSPCWQVKRLSLPIWVEVSADLSVREDETLGVDHVQVVNVYGKYRPGEAETRCFEQRLATLKGKKDSSEVVAALRSHLPLTEHVAFQYPCLACRASRL